MRFAIGIDLGGTEIRAGLVGFNGEVVRHQQELTAANDGPGAVILQIESLIRSVSKEVPERDIIGIGIGCPGPLDPFEGVVLQAPTLRGWIDIPLRLLLSERTGLAVEICNDANAAALGEMRFGAGRGYRHLVCITVGTGIGGGVILNDELVLGRKGLATELGHMTIAEGGPPCSCGNAGCWEALASGTGVAHFAADAVVRNPSSVLHRIAQARKIEAKDITVAAEGGDVLALQLLKQEARYLGVGISNLLHLFSPETVVVGGGVASALHLMLDEIRSTIAKRVMPAYQSIPVVGAALGPKAGLVGAATLVMKFGV